MKTKLSSPAFADHQRMPAALSRHAAEFGLWDGVCHVDPYPATDPPTPPAATPPATPPQDEPLGDGGYRALQEERQQRRALEAQLRAMQEQFREFEGVDPKKYQDAIAAMQRQQEWEQQQAQWKAEQEAKLKQQYEPQLQQQADLAAKAQQELQQYRLQTALKDEFLSAKGIPNKFRYARIDLESRVRLGESGALEVLDAEGKPAYVADQGKSRPMTVAELMAELSKTDMAFASNFEGNSSPGFQVGGDGRFNGADPAFANLSPKEQLDMMRAKGLA